MKVNDALTPQNLPPVNEPEPIRPAGGSAGRVPAAGGDAVELSPDIILADQAVRLAANAGDVRPEAVNRARQLLETGSVGTDLERLADRIIDSLIEHR